MSASSPGAIKAREEREQRHRKEVEALTLRAKKWKLLCIQSMMVLGGCLIVSVFVPFDEWRSDTPPAYQKLRISTHEYGWYHPEKGWCSYEDGRQITPTFWKAE